MNQLSILYPIAGMAGLTFAVLFLIPFQRFKAAGKKRVVADDFKLGESANVPPEVSIPNRNYMNLLEIPILFYAVCLAMFVTQAATPRAVAFAWAYVALRALHSAVHLTYNKVLHRLVFFALSNVVLITLWVQWTVFLSR
jgi:hypothetical protein